MAGWSSQGDTPVITFTSEPNSTGANEKSNAENLDYFQCPAESGVSKEISGSPCLCKLTNLRHAFLKTCSPLEQAPGIGPPRVLLAIQ
eukprot:1161923-Pelagomonas_calceolata.AAC.3